MHFRDRGNSVQVVRVTYDEGTKKPKQTVLGTIPKRTMEPEPAVMQAASAEEKAEIARWIERNREVVAAKTLAEVHSLPDVVRAATRYLETVTDETERSLLQDMMMEASKRLRRAVRPAGEEGEDAEGKAGRGGRKGGGGGGGRRRQEGEPQAA